MPVGRLARAGKDSTGWGRAGEGLNEGRTEGARMGQVDQTREENWFGATAVQGSPIPSQA